MTSLRKVKLVGQALRDALAGTKHTVVKACSSCGFRSLAVNRSVCPACHRGRMVPKLDGRKART